MNKSTSKPGWADALVKAWTEVTEVTFTEPELRGRLEESRLALGIPKYRPISALLSILESAGVIACAELIHRQRPSKDAPQYKPFVRYVKPGLSAFELALSLRRKSYLSHATAAFLHGLISEPKVIYANKEQSPKPRPLGEMTQSGIDRAFSNAPRISQYEFAYEQQVILLLNGKHTGDVGVVDLERTGLPALRTTSIERTLIDLAVRPTYGGGVKEVLTAFRAARDSVNVSRIVELLARIDHAYPYHQALGFYLQRAGLTFADLQPLSQLGFAFNFYLDNKIEDRFLDPIWRVYVPKGL